MEIILWSETLRLQYCVANLCKVGDTRWRYDVVIHNVVETSPAFLLPSFSNHDSSVLRVGYAPTATRNILATVSMRHRCSLFRIVLSPEQKPVPSRSCCSSNPSLVEHPAIEIAITFPSKSLRIPRTRNPFHWPLPCKIGIRCKVSYKVSTYSHCKISGCFLVSHLLPVYSTCELSSSSSYGTLFAFYRLPVLFQEAP
jgi:hypothetical protein